MVAHSLRDTLKKHEKSKFALLKIDFRNAFNEVSRDHFVKSTCEMFPEMTSWTECAMDLRRCCCTTTST